MYILQISSVLRVFPQIIAGAGRVAFSNQQSYIAAISARFVQLQHGDIDKRVRISKTFFMDGMSSYEPDIVPQCGALEHMRMKETLYSDVRLSCSAAGLS